MLSWTIVEDLLDAVECTLIHRFNVGALREKSSNHPIRLFDTPLFPTVIGRTEEGLGA